MTNNKRKLDRHELSANIDVWDARTDDYLGRLVNLHAEGLMLLCQEPLVEDNLYQLRITLPQNLASSGELAVGVDCLWVRAADASEGPEASGGHWAGCQIIDASAHAQSLLDLLISRLGDGT
jgi:hypothetical protein